MDLKFFAGIELCHQTLSCTIIRSDAEFSDAVLERLIQDSVVSSVFVNETQQTADEQAYRNLIEDSLRYINDAERNQFIEENRSEAIGFINRIHDLIALYFQINGNTLADLNRNKNEIDSIISLISSEDSLLIYTNRQTNLDKLNLLITQRNQLFENEFATRELLLEDAISLSENINERGLPDENRKIITPILLNFILNDDFDLIQTMNEQTYIADQCPHSGGVAVYIARAILDSELDTTLYDDRFVCPLQGYFRKGSVDLDIAEAKLILTPNPTKNIVSIYFTDNRKLNGTISIFDNESKLNVFKNVNGKYAYLLDVSSLKNGVYKVGFEANTGESYYTKLIVIR